MAKKVKSPTGRASKVSSAMRDFDKGKKVSGKRTGPYAGKKKVVIKKTTRRRPPTDAERMDLGLPLSPKKKASRKKKGIGEIL